MKVIYRYFSTCSVANTAANDFATLIQFEDMLSINFYYNNYCNFFKVNVFIDFNAQFFSSSPSLQSIGYQKKQIQAALIDLRAQVRCLYDDINFAITHLNLMFLIMLNQKKVLIFVNLGNFC